MEWTIGNKSEYGTHNANIIYAGDDGICQIYGIPSHTTLEDVDVTRYGAGLNHAHLIAAAPELLEALKGWQSLLGSSFLDMTHKEREVFNAGTRAIAKAESK